MTSPPEPPPEKESLLCRIATVEGWIALTLAFFSCWGALAPRGPMLGWPDKALIHDLSPLLPAVIGFGLGLSAARHGREGGRIAGWVAVCCLAPLIILYSCLLFQGFFPRPA